MTRTHIVGASVLAAILAAMTYSHIQWTSPPFTWDRASVTPNIITRAQVLSGIDLQVCKTGQFHYVPSSGETIQDFVPVTMKEGKIIVINGAWKPAGVHHILVPGSLPNGDDPDPAKRGRIDQCRPAPIRLDTSLGVGMWGLRLDSRFRTWMGTVEGLPDLVTIAPFEVTP